MCGTEKAACKLKQGACAEAKKLKEKLAAEAKKLKDKACAAAVKEYNEVQDAARRNNEKELKAAAAAAAEASSVEFESNYVKLGSYEILKIGPYYKQLLKLVPATCPNLGKLG